MFKLVAERITQRHLEYLEMFQGTIDQILLYGTLMGSIISKVFPLNRETNFQSECSHLRPSVHSTILNLQLRMIGAERYCVTSNVKRY